MLRVGGRKLAKLGAKGLSKGLVKKVPILGAVAGVAFGIERFALHRTLALLFLIGIDINIYQDQSSY